MQESQLFIHSKSALHKPVYQTANTKYLFSTRLGNNSNLKHFQTTVRIIVHRNNVTHQQTFWYTYVKTLQAVFFWFHSKASNITSDVPFSVIVKNVHTSCPINFHTCSLNHIMLNKSLYLIPSLLELNVTQFTQLLTGSQYLPD